MQESSRLKCVGSAIKNVWTWTTGGRVLSMEYRRLRTAPVQSAQHHSRRPVLRSCAECSGWLQPLDRMGGSISRALMVWTSSRVWSMEYGRSRADLAQSAQHHSRRPVLRSSSARPIAQPSAACAAQIAQTCSAQAGRTHRADQLRLPQFGSRRPLWRRSKTLEWWPLSTLQI